MYSLLKSVFILELPTYKSLSFTAEPFQCGTNVSYSSVLAILLHGAEQMQ